MESITDLLTPDQIDAIVAAYGTVLDWYNQVAAYIGDQVDIVTEEIWL